MITLIYLLASIVKGQEPEMIFAVVTGVIDYSMIELLLPYLLKGCAG